MEVEANGEIKLGTTKDLLNLVRHTKTLDGAPVYLRSEISFKRLGAEEVFPIAKYVLERRLAELEELEEKIHPYGVSIFDLKSILEIGGGKIGPPVVEYSKKDAVSVIVDGLNRFYLARQKGMNIMFLYITNVDSDYPTVSLPIEWGELVVAKNIPEIAEDRRKLRDGIPNEDRAIRKYFRNFAFLGSSGRRIFVEQGE